VLLLCAAVLPDVHAGTFISGSVRWEKVNDLTARFDVVTYWRRSFTPFNHPLLQGGGKAQLGDKIDVIAQSTVSLNFGDGTAPHFLLATVTNINEDEDWLEAVTTYEHTYSAPYAKKEMVADYSDAASDAPVTEQKFKAQYTPWVATLAGCCRYITLANDADKPFMIRSHVNLESSSRSPDARVLPTVSVKPHGSFKASVTAPLYQPQDMINNTQALRFSWCPSSSWTRPSAAVVELNEVTGMVTWRGTTTSVWYHLCVQGSIDDVMSEVDFMVYVLAADVQVPTCTSVEFDGLPTYGYVGYRLKFEIDAYYPGAEGNVNIAVGYRSRMQDGVPNPTGVSWLVPATERINGKAVGKVDYLVPDWAQGWVAVCFVSYLTNDTSIKSPMECLDLVLQKDETTQLSTSTPDEFKVRTSAGEIVPNSYTMREGQTLPLMVRAFKPPKDDEISLVLSGDDNSKNGTSDDIDMLDEKEAAKEYNTTRLPPWGATLEVIKTGHNATFRISYVPPRGYTGVNVRLCFKARGAEGDYRTIADTQLCVSINIQRCVWTVRESENLVSISQSIGVSWLQVWNYNKEGLSRPDLDLNKGQSLKVGQLYQVAKGDTLFNLGGRFSTSVEMILRMNADLEESGLLLPDQLVCITFNSCKSDMIA